MNKQTPLEIVKNTVWWAEECPVSIQLFDHIMRCFVSLKKIIGRPGLANCVAFYGRGLVSELTPRDEKIKIFQFVLDKLKKEPGYLNKLIDASTGTRQQLLRTTDLIDSNAASASLNELKRMYKKLCAQNIDFVIYGALWEAVDPYTEQYLEHIKEKYWLSASLAGEACAVLSAPTRRSFLTQEKLDFLNLCLGKFTAANYLKKYYWMQASYREAEPVSKSSLYARVTREVKEKTPLQIRAEIAATLKMERQIIGEKKGVAKKIKLKPADQKIFDTIATFGELIDLRKEAMMRATFSRYRLLKAAAVLTKTSLADFLTMTDEEVSNVLAGGKVDKKLCAERRKLGIGFYTPGRCELWVGEKARVLLSAYLKASKSSEIKGYVAYDPGREIEGEVCRVLDVKRDVFVPGKILVTSMTRPDFMPLMRRAKAVITDEGGLTCHAAIVSREMKIPCIIGAKNATKNLKNGDRIRMDFVSGSIFKI